MKQIRIPWPNIYDSFGNFYSYLILQYLVNKYFVIHRSRMPIFVQKVSLKLHLLQELIKNF